MIRTTGVTYETIYPSILRCAILAAGLIAGNAQAAYITGVTATASGFGTTCCNRSINGAVNGSGLSSLSLTTTHAPIDSFNNWLAGNAAGTINFDLHGLYNLSHLSVWNYHGGVPSGGVKDLNILTSTDGINYSALIGSPILFAITTVQPIAAEQFSFTPVSAAYVRFNITSNWGDSTGIGLAEIAFGGSPVPEPSVLALFAVSAAGLVAHRRRKTS